MAETTMHTYLSSSRVSLGEAIARELEQEITGGELSPGQRLGTKEELRGRLKVEERPFRLTARAWIVTARVASAAPV